MEWYGKCALSDCIPIEDINAARLYPAFSTLVSHPSGRPDWMTSIYKIEHLRSNHKLNI